MNTNAMDSGHKGGFYLAEGETPKGFQSVPAGLEKSEPEPGDGDSEEPLIDLSARSRGNRLRRFRCRGRTGAKIQPDVAGGLLLETAA